MCLSVWCVSVCLSVTAEANSHQKQGWETFTDAVVKQLAAKEGIVYLVSGNIHKHIHYSFIHSSFDVVLIVDELSIRRCSDIYTFSTWLLLTVGLTQ